MSPAEFRVRAAELLRALVATDEGQAVLATVAFARRQLAAERAAGGPVVSERG